MWGTKPILDSKDLSNQLTQYHIKKQFLQVLLLFFFPNAGVQISCQGIQACNKLHLKLSNWWKKNVSDFYIIDCNFIGTLEIKYFQCLLRESVHNSLCLSMAGLLK